MAVRSIFLLICLFFYSHLVTCSYEKGDSIAIYHNKVFSLKSQLAYSYPSLDFFCPLTHTSRKKSTLVFDQDLRGDRIIQSDFKINFLENEECKLLCKQALTVENAIQIEELINNEYNIEWEMDGMPGATVSYTNEAPEHNYKIGFPLGFKQGESTFINNHVIFQVLYTPLKHEFGKYEIIGFEIYPDSIAEGECTKKDIDYEYQPIAGVRTQIAYTYSVQWKEVSQDQPMKLWDTFLLKPNQERHHQATINGSIVVGLLCVVVLFILVKTAQKSNMNSNGDYDDVDDFIGWKLINRDVFRRPVYGGLLTPILGGGIQLVVVAIGLIVSLKLGWYHPAQPGSLTRWFTLFFLLGSLPGSYWSARIYKVFRGKSWVLNSILTAFVVPFALVVIIFVTSLITWSQNSSLAISFGGWLSFVFIWLFGLIPLNYVGAYFGERQDRIEYPTRTTQIPRLIPKKTWYQANTLRAIVSGIVPFSIVFLDWNEFLTSMTKGEYTLSIQFLIYISTLLLITVSEITMVMIFLQLCSEDYHWWWQSFMIGSSVSVYMFGYSIFFLFKKTEIEGLIAGTIYVLNLLLGCSAIGLCTSTIGFLSSYWIVNRIYSSVKKD